MRKAHSQVFPLNFAELFSQIDILINSNSTLQSAVLFWLRVYLCSLVLLYFLWKKCFFVISKLTAFDTRIPPIVRDYRLH